MGCGRTVFLRCGVCTSYHVASNTCRQPGCPECGAPYGPWTMREAGLVTDRLKGWQEVNEYPYGPRHVTVSEPPKKAVEDWSTTAGYNLARTRARRAIQAMGSIGEALVPHYFRKKCSICGQAFEFSECVTPDCPGGGIVWEPSPHFHAFTFGRIDASKRPKCFVVKTIGERVESLFEAVRYVLDHATRPRGKDSVHTVTWGGLLSYNKMGLTKEQGWAWRMGLPYPWISLPPQLYPALREKYDSELPRNPDKGRPCPTCGGRLQVIEGFFLEDYLAEDFGTLDRPPPGES